MARNWSRREVGLIVADYFEMLGKHLSGTDLIKAEHRRVLVTKLDGRTHQSVDFKHRNISSVLDELGMVWLDGYQPAANR